MMDGGPVAATQPAAASGPSGASVQREQQAAFLEPSDQQPQQSQSQDICRVCRCEATPDRPLFHPCICTGSIKYIHQECLLQWLRYSKKEFCELCNHRFSFTPIYSPDMPKRLPIHIVVSGFLSTVTNAVRCWLHYTLVALAWLGVVPLTACRIYRTLFTGSVSNILSLPINVFSTENISSDILQGCAVVTLTLLAFIGLVWLREQILHGGGPEWLDNELQEVEQDLREGDEGDGEAVAAAAAAIAGENVDNLPAEPAAPEINGEVEDDLDADEREDDENAQNLGDDGQWNPMEWDRAAEELTWERLLGLDGSLVFLEHVFWVVSLNTLFILVFAFCPYHIGHFAVMGFRLKSYISGAHFEGMLITLCGYCIIGISLVLIHGVTALLRFRRVARLLGLCYVVVKVSLLLVIEIVAFPVICGWWLDICSLSLFDATLKDRQSSYHGAPMASIFLHWLFGMVYVFYFASFVILLREILRPGVLWFLRNLNDPDFNPIQEMIHLSIARHLRRFCASLVMFGTSILVMLYLPSKIIKKIIPTFLPYYTQQNPDSQVDELSMELLLLLVILPAIQDQHHPREWLKSCVKTWCSAVAWMLNLRSYLFGDVPLEEPVEEAEEALPLQDEAVEQETAPLVAEQPEEAVQEPAAPEIGAPAPLAAVAGDAPGGPVELGVAHQALLQREGPTGHQPYNKPSYFPLRLTGLILLMVLTWLVTSFVLMLAPVWLGRKIFQLFVTDKKVYELYTSSTGIYVFLLTIRGSAMVSSWLRQGWTQMSQKFKEWVFIGAKASVAMFLLIGLIPFLFGVLLEVIVLTPLRVPLNQSPVYFLWQDWALGAMYTKISIALTFMGPDWWMKAAIERLYQDGMRGLDLTFLLPKLVVPVVTALGLALALPYVIAHSLAPIVLASEDDMMVMVQRRIFPFLLVVLLMAAGVIMQLKHCRKLYEHIKNDRYLVGRRLVNYNHPAPSTGS